MLNCVCEKFTSKKLYFIVVNKTWQWFSDKHFTSPQDLLTLESGFIWFYRIFKPHQDPW